MTAVFAVGEHTLNELLKVSLDDTTKIIAIAAIVVTFLIIVGVAAVRDLRKYSTTVFDTGLHRTRARLIRKYVEKSADEDANDGLTPDTRTSETHYRMAFAVKGSRRPLILETVSGEWEKLPEAGEGLLEYSGGLLVSFKPEAK